MTCNLGFRVGFFYEAALYVHDFPQAKAYDWDTVMALLTDHPDLVNKKPAGRWSCLHQAAEAGLIIKLPAESMKV